MKVCRGIHRALDCALEHEEATVAVLVGFFCLAVFLNLDRFPPVHDDEAQIISPGYKLFHKGVYGCDLCRGMGNGDRLLLAWMPLLSVLQGAVTRLTGLGVAEMRLPCAFFGAMTAFLTCILGRRLGGPGCGALAGILALMWQWIPGNNRMLGSGIPLVDLSRIGRYDIPVPFFGLLALLTWMHARDQNQKRFYVISGMTCGLAGLSHLYGYFWLLILLCLMAAEDLRDKGRLNFASAALVVAGTAMASAPWIVILLVNRSEIPLQFMDMRDRFDLFSIGFYLRNLAGERDRYLLGLRDSLTYLKPGFWLLVLGIPALLIMLGRKAWRCGDRAALRILVPCVLLPLFFALIVKTKAFNYLATVVPVFIIAVAWGFGRIMEEAGARWRWVASAALFLVVLQGGLSLGRLQVRAARSQAPDPYYAEIRRIVPAGTRVLGLARHWFGIPDESFQSFHIPFVLSDAALSPSPIPFKVALRESGPGIIFLDETILNALSDPGFARGRQCKLDLEEYMRQHQAVLLSELRAPWGERVWVYQLHL